MPPAPPPPRPPPPPPRTRRPPPRPAAAARGLTWDEIIRSAIWQAVSANNGTQTAAARQLGISRTTMWRYLKQEDKPAKAAGKRAEQ